MTLKDAEVIRQLRAEIESLKNQVSDLTRRLDDFSKAERAKNKAA